jgi:hypothetical protein
MSKISNGLRHSSGVINLHSRQAPKPIYPVILLVDLFSPLRGFPLWGRWYYPQVNTSTPNDRKTGTV